MNSRKVLDDYEAFLKKREQTTDILAFCLALPFICLFILILCSILGIK